jgi:hypothetical protein
MLNNSHQGRELNERQGGQVDRRSNKVIGAKYIERRLPILRDLANTDKNFRFLIALNMHNWNMVRALTLLEWVTEDYEARTGQWTLRNAAESREVRIGFYRMVQAAQVSLRRRKEAA